MEKVEVIKVELQQNREKDSEMLWEAIAWNLQAVYELLLLRADEAYKFLLELSIFSVLDERERAKTKKKKKTFQKHHHSVWCNFNVSSTAIRKINLYIKFKVQKRYCVMCMYYILCSRRVVTTLLYIFDPLDSTKRKKSHKHQAPTDKPFVSTKIILYKTAFCVLSFLFAFFLLPSRRRITIQQEWYFQIIFCVKRKIAPWRHSREKSCWFYLIADG